MRPAVRKFVALVRSLHVYLTMLVLLPLAFIALTGLMLNHEGWFGRSRAPLTRTTTGQLPAGMLRGPDRLAVVERLRAEFGAAGAVDAFETDDDQLRVSFTRPGGRTDAFIDRASGQAEVTREYDGWANVLADLHRGKTAGRAWRWLIDAAAVGLLLAAVTGIVLWLTLPKRWLLGAAALAAAAATWGAIFRWLVP